MKNLKIAIGQIKVVAGQPSINTEKIKSEIKLAREKKVDIIIFPEMAVPGYLLGDEWENDRFVEDCVSFNDEILNETHGITAIWGNVFIDKSKRNEDGRIRKYNAAFIAQNGKWISNGIFEGHTFKTLMPKYREFDDERHFYSLRKYAIDNNFSDFGLRPFELEVNGLSHKVGIILCEDMWSDDYSINPTEILIENGAEIIINLSCSPWTWKKNDKRHRVVKSLISEHNVPFVYCNNVGTQNNGKNIFLFDGSSTFYSPGGEIAYEAEPYIEETLIIDTGITSKNKVEKRIHNDIEELYNGLVYGIKGFVKNMPNQRVVIGISGGIDSAVVAALLAEAVGSNNVYGINMPSYFNSNQTKSAALKLAQNLGINYTTVSIQDSFNDTVEQFQKVKFLNFESNESLAIELSQLVKENIQARDRGSRILAGIASSLGAIFTNNGNKTETAIGYATLYGDVNGAIAPIADIYKNQVYELAKYINKINKSEIIPESTWKLPPSAELSKDQNVDEGKGDPINYPYHDKLLRSFIEYRKDPEDILNLYFNNTLEEELQLEEGLLSKSFKSELEFINDLEHKWRLYKINIFKRIQAPPIIAVSKRAFGFDLRESQNGFYYTKGYLELKKRILSKN